jgi:hypothetical protein
MHPRLAIPILLLVTAAPAVAADSPRFQATASIELRRTSDDGRFSAVAHARREHAAAAGDGRFVLKASAATCDPNDDSLFRNGFETP